MSRVNIALAWFPVAALLLTVQWFNLFFAQLSIFASRPAVRGIAVFAAFALISYLTDSAWRISTDKWPAYKRHFALMGLLLLFIALTNLCFFQAAAPAHIMLASAAGIIAGLFASILPIFFGSRDPSYGWRLGSSKRPDPSRPLIIVADPHWGSDLAGLFEANKTLPEADWLFLGDVFDVWVGIKGFETDAQRSLLWWVSERRRTGAWVGLWLGNRDYFLDRLAEKFDFIGEGTKGQLEGEAFVFEHGDLINTSDRKYRFWNILSRSAPLWLFAKAVPSFLGAKLTLFLERKLRATNMEHKIYFPKTDFQKAVEANRPAFFITGHFHALEEAENGISVPWAHFGQFYVWQSGANAIFALNTGK